MIWWENRHKFDQQADPLDFVKKVWKNQQVYHLYSKSVSQAVITTATFYYYCLDSFYVIHTSYYNIHNVILTASKHQTQWK